MTTLQEAVLAAADGLERVYSHGAVPASPTYPYTAVSGSLGRGTTYTLDEHEGGRDARIVAQHFGRDLAGALDFAEDLRGRLVGAWLTVTGYDPALVRSELDPTPVSRDPDDNGVVTVTATYALTAMKEQA